MTDKPPSTPTPLTAIAATALRRPPSSFPSSALPRRPGRSRWSSSSPFLRVGLPFMAFLGLSTLILSSFLQDQYERQRRQQKWEGAESELQSKVGGGRQEGPTLKGTEQRKGKGARAPQFDLNEEYQRMVATLDLDFENVRVPRPDEIAERTKVRRAQKAAQRQPQTQQREQTDTAADTSEAAAQPSVER